MLISDDYRQINNALHNNPDYGRGGHKWARRLTDYLAGSILDYGCGKGTLAKALNAPRLTEYDPAIPGKDAEPEPHHYIVCTDVLEHIEPECLDDVLAHMRRLMLSEGFFVVSTKYAKKTLPDGRNAHLIVRPSWWWMEKLGHHFMVNRVEVLHEEDNVIFWVEP